MFVHDDLVAGNESLDRLRNMRDRAVDIIKSPKRKSETCAPQYLIGNTDPERVRPTTTKAETSTREPRHAHESYPLRQGRSSVIGHRKRCSQP